MTAAKALRHDASSDDQELGDGRKLKISISIDQSLLARIDKHAKQLGISRSSLFAISAGMYIDNLLERRRE